MYACMYEEFSYFSRLSTHFFHKLEGLNWRMRRSINISNLPTAKIRYWMGNTLMTGFPLLLEPLLLQVLEQAIVDCHDSKKCEYVRS